MKREFRQENFEEFLKRNADNLRMKAPERIWENVSGELRKGRRRLRAGLIAFFLTTAVLGYLTIGTSDRQVERPLQSPASALAAADNYTAKARTWASSPTATSATNTIRTTAARRNKPAPATLAKQNPPATEAATGIQVAGQVAQNEFTPTVVDDSPETEEPAKELSNAAEKPALLTQPNRLPWTIESTVNSYVPRKKPAGSRFQTQFHFAPTISYRKLTENKSYLRNSPQGFASNNYAALYNSVNNMVTHKPDIGFELGLTEKYAVSQKVLIRAGLQLNVNRYDIKAFHAPFALAAIALNNRRTATVDSLWTISNYSNVAASNGNQGSWLQNFSFQASAPVGVELLLKGTEKMQFGIAGTVQPTYVLGDRTYMITNDYKSYTQIPWLLRRWNVNTAFETFVTYQAGKARWQVGPQIRYQLLSSFISNYPVKENLFDFGLKIGVSVPK